MNALIEKARMEHFNAHSNGAKGPELEAFEDIAAKQIEKLWFLDNFDTILLDNGQHVVLEGEHAVWNKDLATRDHEYNNRIDRTSWMKAPELEAILTRADYRAMINVAAGMMTGLPTPIHDARPAEEATRKTKAAAAEGGYTAVSAPASSCEELHPYHPCTACDLESPGTGAEMFRIETIRDTALHGRDPKPDKREVLNIGSVVRFSVVRFSSKSRLNPDLSLIHI